MAGGKEKGQIGADGRRIREHSRDHGVVLAAGLLPWRLGPHARVWGVSVNGCSWVGPPSMTDLEDGGGSGR